MPPNLRQVELDSRQALSETSMTEESVKHYLTLTSKDTKASDARLRGVTLQT